MLTPGEVGAIEAALGQLGAQVNALQRHYEQVRNYLWFVAPDETTSRARAAVDGRRKTLDTFRRERDRLVELPDFDHEAVTRLVDGAHRIAADGLVRQLEREFASGGRVLVTPDQAVAGAKAAGAAVTGSVPWLKFALVVAGLGVLVYGLKIVRSFWRA